MTPSSFELISEGIFYLASTVAIVAAAWWFFRKRGFRSALSITTSLRAIDNKDGCRLLSIDLNVTNVGFVPAHVIQSIFYIYDVNIDHIGSYGGMMDHGNVVVPFGCNAGVEDDFHINPGMSVRLSFNFISNDDRGCYFVSWYLLEEPIKFFEYIREKDLIAYLRSIKAQDYYFNQEVIAVEGVWPLGHPSQP